MKNINVGIVKTIILNKLNESLLNENLLNESKENLTKFFEIIRNSPILQLEYKIFKNLENKYIDNDIIATRYIDNNIRLFENFSKNEISTEHNKLKEFINESDINLINKNQLLLNESIINLIFETSKNNDDTPNIDLIHESFLNVLNHIKTNKENIIENVITENNNKLNENIIEIAINKFNQKYETLNLDEKNLLNNLIKYNINEKKSLFENFKHEAIKILEDLKNDEIQNEINESIKNINNTEFNDKTINEDIIRLFELKKSLLSTQE